MASARSCFRNAFGLGAAAFATLPDRAASSPGSLPRRACLRGSRVEIGTGSAVKLGAIGHIVLCAAFALLSVAGYLTYPLLLVFWCGFCGLLAVRGPPSIRRRPALAGRPDGARFGRDGPVIPGRCRAGHANDGAFARRPERAADGSGDAPSKRREFRADYAVPCARYFRLNARAAGSRAISASVLRRSCASPRSGTASSRRTRSR